jgi:hypothetical protein
MSYRRIIIDRFGGPEVLKLVEEKSLPEPEEGQNCSRIHREYQPERKNNIECCRK